MECTKKVLPVTLTIATALLLTACGGGPSTSSSKTPFINHTGMQETDFQALAQAKWKQAQTATSSQWIDLWAAYRVIQSQPVAPECYTGKISCDGFISPIPAAASLEPRGVVVAAVPDVPSGANTPNHPTNPTGIIECDGGSGYCQAYVVFNPCSISVPESKPDNMGPYEMQNCILQELGQNTSRR